MEKPGKLRSNLSKARGLGSAHHGVMHWWWQRLTAIAIIPLAMGFLCSLMHGLLSPDVVRAAEWLANPASALMMVLLLIAVFIHAKLGLQVVIEDYVKCNYSKYALLLANEFISYGAIALGILSVLKLHWLDVIAAVS